MGAPSGSPGGCPSECPSGSPTGESAGSSGSAGSDGLRPVLAAVLPLSDGGLAAAFRSMRSRRAVGKVVIDVGGDMGGATGAAAGGE